MRHILIFIVIHQAISLMEWALSNFGFCWLRMIRALTDNTMINVTFLLLSRFWLIFWRTLCVWLVVIIILLLEVAATWGEIYRVGSLCLVVGFFRLWLLLIVWWAKLLRLVLLFWKWYLWGLLSIEFLYFWLLLKFGAISFFLVCCCHDVIFSLLWFTIFIFGFLNPFL